MGAMKEEIIGEIQTELANGWQQSAKQMIFDQIKAMPGTNLAENRFKVVRQKALEKAESDKFTALWLSSFQPQFNSQYDSLYPAMQHALLTRHPWLREERAVPPTESLQDRFLKEALRAYLFESLSNKSAGATEWNKLLIQEHTIFTWQAFEPHNLPDKLRKKIQGYPLSDAGFYDDRKLPSYLGDPFTQAPTRYDLYRILKKSYSNKFRAQLVDGIHCTKIAPLHHSELATLSPAEKIHLETIVVNVGSENMPQWVLLHKQQGRWTLYAPDTDAHKYSTITDVFTDVTIVPVRHGGQSISNSHDWNQIVLARILPWTQQVNPPVLNDFRATIPVPLLQQYVIEASCLPAQTAYAQQAKRAFATRAPLSHDTAQDIYTNTAAAPNCLFPDIPASTAEGVIQAFDSGAISYDPTHGNLSIYSKQHFVEAMKLAYFEAVPHITITELPDGAWQEWFACNLTLTEITAPAGEAYGYLHACAARNRFLAQAKPSYLSDAVDAHQARRSAWDNSGELMYTFLKHAPQDRAQAANLAAMGKPGLDTCFAYLDTRTDPAALSCTLMLDCGHTTTSADYLTTLQVKIAAYPQNKKPLFAALTLVLPEQALDQVAQTALKNVLQALNNRNDLKELQLEPAGISGELLAALTRFASEADLRIQIKIPAWDEQALADALGPCKAQYRALQNAILSNIRRAEAPEMRANTATIERPLPVACPLKPELATESVPITWGNDTYPLGALSAGVQQQAQQEVAQEVQQEAERQGQPKTPLARQIFEYTGDEAGLYSRSKLPEGVSDALFSAWVGSTQDAPGIIAKFDAAAVAQLQAFPGIAKFGLDPNRTPGFRLYRAPSDRTYILSYDASLEAQDIVDLASDPFAIRMNAITPKIEFCGDYRQFVTVETDESPQLSLWQHLATETVPAAIQTWLQGQGIQSSSSACLQYHNVHANLPAAVAVAEQTVAIAMLQTWATAQLGLSDETFAQALLADASPKNLQALGQLFYHHDAEGLVNWFKLMQQIAAKFPQKLAISTDATLNPLTVFKRRCLDPLEDWSECLEKDEVDALTASIAKLSGQASYTKVLWKLIDRHGAAVGRMRYAEVWRAYEMVLDYLDANELTMNPQAFLDAIDQYGDDFNATQLLRRLHTVLQHTGNRQDSAAVQQAILDNFARIDWHENGLCYACEHDHYRYWDEVLELRAFSSCDGQLSGSYQATWQVEDLRSIHKPLLYTLRYAAQTLRINKTAFNDLHAALRQVATGCPDLPQQTMVMRLISASITLGVDDPRSIQAISADVWHALAKPAYANLLTQINQLLPLNTGDLRSLSYHVRMQDLPVLLAALQANPIQPLTLDTLNALGRALRCYSPEQQQQQLAALIAYGKSHDFAEPLITAYPWLVATPLSAADITDTDPDVQQQRTRFTQQLSTIDFSRTPSAAYPNKEQLRALIAGITDAASRHAAVKQLLDQGCVINDQDAGFRRLLPNEKDACNDLFLAKTFRGRNQPLLARLSDKLAVDQAANPSMQIQQLQQLFTKLDRKSYYNELGQLLGLLLEKNPDKFYSLEQLTLWLTTVFDETTFQTKPYPLAFIAALLDDALQDENSSLLNADLRQLQGREQALEPLLQCLHAINCSPLPESAQKTLVKCAIRNKRKPLALTDTQDKLSRIFAATITAPAITAAICELLDKRLAHQPDDAALSMLARLTERCGLADDPSMVLWQANQSKLLDGWQTGLISTETIAQLQGSNDAATRLILVAAYGSKDRPELIPLIQQQLTRMSPTERAQLAAYFSTDPKPNLSQLQQLLAQFPNQAQPLIDHFERVVQAEGKRLDSLEVQDIADIKRVLSGLKLKKERTGVPQAEQTALLNSLYYLNTYSHVSKLEQKSNAELVALIHANKTEETPAAHARVMACMREMVLRKTGKWVNHTQMVALLYAAEHNDDNLLHQIRMGEGKSIISLMRVPYRAFKGQLVDIYSSKESLSWRDHQESVAVLDAFGIRHSHIVANPAAASYKTDLDANGTGAVHYAIIGNWSLRFEDLCWHGDATIDPTAANRVAYLDEGDHILRHEHTLFNFSDQTGPASVYNYDTWAYEIVYQYYVAHQKEFATAGGMVAEQPHLQALYQQLQAGATQIAPDKSTLFRRYLASGDAEMRNQKLVGMLTAAHLAQGLVPGKDFCVMTEQKKISESATLETRFAKVVINNQVYHGSTYSDLVQQFLHVRLNEEAVARGETPNFFVEPESTIVLSLNAAHVLKNYYRHIEACTGTAGDAEALQFYADEFGINRVTKLPTHVAIATVFMPPIFSDDEDAQVAAIVEAILGQGDQPQLITCEDDKAVTRLGKKIQAALAARDARYQIALDTNDSGLSEADILKDAGRNYAITISARMGRGSDFKPEDRKRGLSVIRTYPAPPEVVKQEYGRQGRYGAGGRCQDIFNYAPILAHHQEELSDQEFQKLWQYETEHLTEKLAKPNQLTKKNKPNWQAIATDVVLKERYLINRTLQHLQHDRDAHKRAQMQRRNALLIEGSAAIMAHLQGLQPGQSKTCREAWQVCRHTLETTPMSDTAMTDLRHTLDAFYTQNGITKPQLASPTAAAISPMAAPDAEVDLAAKIQFHQAWLRSMLQADVMRDPKVVSALYGREENDLNSLYPAFEQLNAPQLATLTEFVSKEPRCHYMSCAAWLHVMTLLHQEPASSADFLTRMQDFFVQKNPTKPTSAEDVRSLSEAFVACVEGMPDIEFIERIIDRNFTAAEAKQLRTNVTWTRPVVNLCKDHMNSPDIVFFLKQLLLAPPDKIHGLISTLGATVVALQAQPNVIRPLSHLLLNHPDASVFIQPAYDAHQADVFTFLSRRPEFDATDYAELTAKIAELKGHPLEKNFLQSLRHLPPYMSVRSVLHDLSDLPGSYTTAEELAERMQLISTANQACIAFLFEHDIISQKNDYVAPAPAQRQAYLEWLTLVANLPLDKRSCFFSTIKDRITRRDLPLSDLATLARNYVRQTNGEFRSAIDRLQTPPPAISSAPAVSTNVSKATQVNPEPSTSDDPKLGNKENNKPGFFTSFRR